jgi:hypothetical protein
MRNYDQLRAAALASGTFALYVGDGASVPWQVALPFNVPLGFTMWTYKAYLDLRWPEGFRLHDWAYTPYGQLINITREEADYALYEFIARDSGIDAWIVLTAVRAYGDPWFGHSQTGYHGLQSEASVSNMFLAGRDP